MRLDYTFDLKFNDSTSAYTIDNGFTSEELRKIYNDLKNVPFEKASTVGGHHDEIRSSRVKWIPQNDEWVWLYSKMSYYALEANSNLWGFNLHSLPEQIQYTEYLASEKGHYTWHQDIGPDTLSVRKISITVQLSHPDEYDGGDLQIHQGGDIPENCSKGEGTVVIFPSYMMHRVSPVTRGIRRSFVLWLGGGHYT